MTNSEKTIVAFHIGRGGRFHNAGHLSFVGCRKIGDFTDDLFDTYENRNEFKDRYGFDYADGGRCILDLIGDEEWDELEEKFGITEEMLGEKIYVDGGGNPVGLTQDEVDSGIGRINIDFSYDTTYTCYLKDCDEDEIHAIKNSQEYIKDDLLELIEEQH